MIDLKILVLSAADEVYLCVQHSMSYEVNVLHNVVKLGEVILNFHSCIAVWVNFNKHYEVHEDLKHC